MTMKATKASDEELPLNCPWCGQTLRFVGTAEDAKAKSWSVPLFECRMHGSLYLTTEGLRREPPATKP